MTETAPPRPRIVFVTGPSGAGRTTAMAALEDLGFEAISNMPLHLLPALVGEDRNTRDLALGFDARTRDFSIGPLLDAILELGPTVGPEILYLDARLDVLERRFSETRRRHPLALEDPLQVGLAREADLLAPIRARADVLLDTSDTTPHDLRAEIERWYKTTDQGGLNLSVQSFSYKRGLPRGLDMVFDVRFLANPYWDPALRQLDGRRPEVAAYIAADDRFDPFFTHVTDLLLLLLPAYLAEGKSYLSIGFGCTGGQHRSVAMTEALAKTLAERGWQVSKRHRELERRGLSGPSQPQGTPV